MRVLKVNSDQFEWLYNDIIKHDGDDLYSIYNNFSCYKRNAYNYCVNLAKEYKATHYGVLNGNTMQFTFGFTTIDEYGVIHVYKITKNYDTEYIIK